ncbi:hypothetical protein FPOA_13291 [Fusarium poae]|uniref:Uncharacterized protein n=1 Tax=Fusarium poae TaxID=36050 RepID=A0A1B8A637_FUSPO|nr:hypothetical protein FPOA_13291 [Fusarium poae]
MTPKLPSARKRGRPSLNRASWPYEAYPPGRNEFNSMNRASSSPDYPTQRSLHAAQRIHQACGMWPTEFCKGFVPETWGVRLIESLSTLVSDLSKYGDKNEEETGEDPDLTVEDEESAPHKRNLWSRSRDIGDIQDDEPMEDTIAANPRSGPAIINGQSRGSPVASSSGSSSGSNAAESSACPRRDFQPPSRLAHDTSRSSIRRPEGPDEQASTQPREPPSSQTTAPLTSASQNAQGAQRSGVQPLKQTASSVPGHPQTPVSFPATTPQGTTRPPQQQGSQGSATAAQNSVQLRAQSSASLPTPQSARQPDQQSSSQPSMSGTSSQSPSTPRAQASSQPALSRCTGTTSQASQSFQQQPNHRPSASINTTPQASLHSHLGGSQPSTPRPIAPARANKRPAPPSPVNTFTSTNNFINRTAASISESLTAPLTKRQKTADIQCPSSQVTGSLDWNALLPTGDEFRASLKAASAALFPHIKSFEELLTSINDEHCRLTAFERSLRPTKNEQATEQEKAQDALKDVEKSMATENKLLRDLEDLYNKYPGDNELRTFLDKRRRTVREHEEVYTAVKIQLDKSASGLFKTDSKIALATKRIGQLEAEKAEVMKEKMGINTAAKRLMLISRFIEPGWQARLAMVEEALGEEVMQFAFS